MESLVHGMLSNAAAVTVLAAAVAIAGRLCRRPALIHSVCLLAMLKLVTPPVVSLPVPVAVSWFADPPAPPSPEPVESSSLPEVADAAPDETIAALDDIDGEWPPEEPAPADIPEAAPAPWRWEAVALGLMLAGALAWWALAALRIVRFQRLLRDVEPIPPEWRDEAAALAARLGLRRPPSAHMVPGDLPPMLWAFGPSVRLLVPSRLWRSLGDDERTALLLHELAHLKRRDHWVRWFELAVVGLYWWHPAVWWIRRALREAEEQCCDAWVVWAMPRGGARTYAAALVAALEFVSGARTTPAAAASATIGSGHVSSLKRRLRMIVRANTPRGLSWAGRLAVAGLSALLLPLAPSWARKEAPPAAYAELDGDLRSIGERFAADLEAIDAQADLEAAKKADVPRALAGIAEAQYARAAAKLFDLDMQLLDSQTELDATKAQFVRMQELADDDDAPRSPLRDAELEDRIREEFKKDPEIQPLIDRLNKARETLERSRNLARNGNEPAVVAAAKTVKKLEQQWNELWQNKHDKMKVRLETRGIQRHSAALAEQVAQLESTIEQLKKKREDLVVVLTAMKAQDEPAKPREARPDEKGDEPKQDAGRRETSERIQQELKELKEKLGKDLDPVTDTVRRSLERALDEIQQALRKDGVTAEDLRRAVEKSRREVADALRRGGPVEKEVREAAERARKDMQEAMERQLNGVMRGREEMKGRMEEGHAQQQKAAEAMREQMRKRAEQRRAEAQERQATARREAERLREAARARTRRQQEETRDRAGGERPKAQEKPAAGAPEKSDRGEAGREDLDAARREIRELQQRLQEANSRLERLQRRDTRRPLPFGRPLTPARPAAPRRPEAPDRPAAPRRPEPPDRPATPAAPARPAEPRGARDRDDSDRRIRDLEDKMDRLLKELQEIKGRPAPGADAPRSS